MAKVRRVEILVEVEVDDEPGKVTRYQVIGATGSIYRRNTHIEVKPHYGNPGMPATQVEVHIDAMLLPIGNETLVSIVVEDAPVSDDRRLPPVVIPQQMITMKEIVP